MAHIIFSKPKMLNSIPVLLMLCIAAAQCMAAQKPQHGRFVAIGRVAAIRSEDLDVVARGTTFTIATDTDTKIWRGDEGNTLSSLKVGDKVDVVYVKDGNRLVALSITANAGRVSGKLIKIDGDNLEVAANDNIERPSGYSQQIERVVIDRRTHFLNSEQGDLRVGRHIEVDGYRVSDSVLRAIKVIVYDGNRPVRAEPGNVMPTSGPDNH